MPSSKNGNPRKSRLPRLGVATFSGTPRFRPKKAGWKSIEQAYGTTFTRAQKRGLTEIVLAYFRDQPFERAAPFAGDASRSLEGVTKSACEFVRALRIPEEGSTREAVFRVRDLIEIAAPSLNLAHLEGLTRGFVVACHAAKRDLEQEAKARIEEGQAWNALVRSEFRRRAWAASGGLKRPSRIENG